MQSKGEIGGAQGSRKTSPKDGPSHGVRQGQGKRWASRTGDQGGSKAMNRVAEESPSTRREHEGRTAGRDWLSNSSSRIKRKVLFERKPNMSIAIKVAC